MISLIARIGTAGLTVEAKTEIVNASTTRQVVRCVNERLYVLLQQSEAMKQEINGLRDLLSILDTKLFAQGQE